MVMPFASAYHATKYAIEGLSESLRFELKQHGVLVKLVEPGHVRTDFVTRSLQWAEQSDYEPQLGNWVAQVARADQRAPGCERVAKMIFKAATDHSDRLRYPVHGRLLLAMRAMLPDALWRAVLLAAMDRHPRDHSGAAIKDQS